MDFPGWAPQSLVDFYLKKLENREKFESIKLSSYEQRRENIHKALITKPEMERVWKMLYEKRRKYPVDSKEPKSHGDRVMALSLLHAIEMAISATNKKFTTRNEDVQKYREIAKSARFLALKVSESKLDSSLFEWISVEAINTMLERDINPDKAAGFFVWRMMKAMFTARAEFTKKLDFNVKMGSLLANIGELWQEIQKSFLPTLSLPLNIHQYRIP